MNSLGSNVEIPRARRKFTEQVVMTVLFTVIELWAIVAVVVLIDASGVLAVAAALALSAGLMYVIDSWRAVRSRSRELRSLMESAETESLPIDHHSNLVRL